MDESFGSLNVVIGLGGSEAIDAEGVAVGCGWAKFAVVVAFFPGCVTDDVFTVGTPVSGSVEEVSDNREFKFVLLRELWGEFEFGVWRSFRMCRMASVGDHLGCSCLKVISFLVFSVMFFDV